MGTKKPGLVQGKISRQQSKLLMRSGGELDEMMMSSVVEKMNKGGDAKRLVKGEDGLERKQSYKLGGGSHNTYSG
tara:strand:+ start:1645 stop:1869 length:225 start_codon:yes stop_codon:yes gene_type:complete